MGNLAWLLDARTKARLRLAKQRLDMVDVPWPFGQSFVVPLASRRGRGEEVPAIDVDRASHLADRIQHRVDDVAVERGRALELLAVLAADPFQNPPQYEKLVGDLAGAYSRRINIQLRLVYEVFPKERVVRVLRMWTRYE